MPDKKSLRSIYIQKRKELNADELRIFNQNIHQHFLHYFSGLACKNAHIYLPIARLIEVDTWPLIAEFQRMGLDIYVPKFSEDDHQMQSAKLKPETECKTNKWGAPEPLLAEIHDQKIAIDVLIAPLLAYDVKGYRVGYGKGYYDRFISQLNPVPRIIGLSFFEPELLITDVDTYDMAMNACATPEGIKIFP